MERWRLYNRGLTDGEAGKILGITSVGYCLWRKRNGLEAKNRPWARKPRRAKFRADAPFCDCGNLIVPGQAHRHAVKS
jgi:hypothetical protein